MIMTSGKRWLTAAFVGTIPLLIDLVYLYQRGQETAPINIPAYAPLPSPNGFDLYMKAAHELASAKSTANLTPAEVTAPNGLVAQSGGYGAWLNSQTSTWALMAQAKTLPTRLPNLRATDLPVLHWAPLRELARAQAVRIQEAKRIGRWDEAANIGLDTLEMGRNLEHGASLINGLVSMAIEAVAFPPLEDVPAHLDAAQAKRAARRLEGVINTAQPYSDVLREEKWRAVTALNTTGTLSNSRHATVFESVFAPRVSLVPGAIATMNALIPQADKPKAAQKIVSPSNDFADACPDFSSATTKTLYNNARRNTQERLLLLRLALHAYALEHGAYPPQLASLAPLYMQKVPVDPYGKGELFRYQPSGSSYILWSIGPDGLDNRATPIPLKAGQKRVVIYPDSKGDIVAHP